MIGKRKSYYYTPHVASNKTGCASIIFLHRAGGTLTIAGRFLTARLPFRATMSALSAKLFWRHNCDDAGISN